MYNPFADKKFMTGLVDMVFVLATYFVGKYAPANVFEDMKIVVAAIQPLVALLIAGYWQADQMLLRNGVMPSHLK